MPLELAHYDELVHAIYDAGLQPARWSNTVGRLAHAFEAPRALLFTFAHKPSEGGFAFTHNIAQSTLEQWAAKAMQEDPFVRAGHAKGVMRDGLTSIDEDLVSQQELLATSFYKELWEPLGIARLCTGVVFDGTDAHKLPTACSLYRHHADPPFMAADANILRRLVAHLSRALGVMFHLRDSQLRLAASLAALDRLASGVLLLASSCQVQFANRAAQAVLAEGSTVRVTAADMAEPARLQLHPRLLSFERRFQQLVALALQPLAEDAGEHFSEALVLPAADGRPACVVHVAPLAESHPFATGGANPKAIMFLYDLQSAATVRPEQLCSLFGMTLAESQAALQVTQGGSVDDMARRLSVSANTFKTQLQAAYAKSGTHRQVDLLKLLLGLASR